MVVTALHPTTTAGAARASHVARRLRQAVGANLYAPALGVALVAAFLVAAGLATHWGGADFAASAGQLHLVVAGPVSLLVLGIILVVERLRPAQQRPLFSRGHRQDVLFALVHGSIGVLLITALTLSFEELLRRALPWTVLPRMALAPHVVVVALVFVAMDACNWFVHLANHRVRVLWRFHELHHSQEDLNALTVFRTHPLIHVSYLLALLPGIVLLANGGVSAALLIVYGGIVAFAHSNTDLTFGPLGRIVVSPNYHRIHHRLDGAQDVNLAFVFTIWDQLSHRAVFPTRLTVGIDTGLPGRPLTVEHEGPRARHLATLVAQLTGPFRPMREPVQLPTVREESGSPIAVRGAA